MRTEEFLKTKEENILKEIWGYLINNLKFNKEMRIRQMLLILLDIILIIASMIGTLLIRHDFRFTIIDPKFIESIWQYMGMNVCCTLIIFGVFRLYTSLWRFASVVELTYIACAVMCSSVLQTIGMRYLELPVPRSYPFLYSFVLLVLVTGCRFSYRFLRVFVYNVIHKKQRKKKVMIVGAGAAGFMISKELQSSKHLNKKVVCVIDDNPAKVGTYLQGVRVVGRKSNIPYYVEKYKVDEIIIAIPTIGREAKKELLDICNTTSCHTLILPGIYQLVNETVSVSMLREVEIDDLLGRAPVKLDLDDVKEYVKGRTVLVTGGGGSIGSELCRQIAQYDPKQLIIFDIAENTTYELQQELKRKMPDFHPTVLIGSVRNKKRVDQIFETYQPDLVFHAAAHKHVPLMEDSPNEAIKNNIGGTYNIADACHRYGTKKMVLISTDKAVRPTNIMGASKRICELVIQAYAQFSDTEYAAVRFGNVLGSNGSVIPLFKQQIAEGGPVTVTHPDIIRYFMTIPEAVNLVLQCGALAQGGEIFILDMGEPVKIVDLAEQLIRLSGLTPGEDIEIVFTGLRPGEKLYEELLINEANLKNTTKERIFVGQQKYFDGEGLKQQIEELIECAYEEEEDIRHVVQKLVPEYVIKND